jgi:ferredoxin
MASLSQREWDEAVNAILAGIHPVDQSATLIWLRFWPLRLCQALESSPDPQEAAKKLELDGRWDLRQQIDSSISFFYGARFWPSVKKAVLDRAIQPGLKGEERLAEHFRQAARQAAAQGNAEESLTLGISAAAFMTLRQVGWEAFSETADNPSAGPLETRTPQKVLKTRQKKRSGLFDFLNGLARQHRVQWEERRPEAHFPAREGQDISAAAAGDDRDYSSVDPRRIEGPIPAQCRSAACGYCWIGILEGRENIDPVSDFEQGRLHYFGYHPREGQPEPHPLIRLACQSKCRGNLTLVVPPWNGVLDGQR